MKILFIFLLMGLVFSHAKAGTFSIEGDHFLMDGKPFQILSGEMHYPRIPRDQWALRMRAARAMGLNSITTYVFWNQHEETPGVYDFSGDNDLAAFLQTAKDEGLFVLLRPGPYVCAEWEFGGFPAWLLKDGPIGLRSPDPRFMIPVTRWFKELGKRISPFLISQNGPVIAVQVENEYGSFGNDSKYLESIRDLLTESGFRDVLMYTSNPTSDLANGSLPSLLSTVNFGPGRTERAFNALRSMRPSSPLMVGEYWAGWFDAWGSSHSETDVEKEATDLRWMLQQGASVNLYMFHGGTNFGWMNGANSDGISSYSPYVTSYDYRAALDESGKPTPKFFAFKDVIESVTGKKSPPFPELNPVIAIAPVTTDKNLSLRSILPSPVKSMSPLTMESLGQNYGYILYRTKISGGGTLSIPGLHDYARIFVDGAEIGTLDRRLLQSELAFTHDGEGTLEILVENSGRANYSQLILTEQKGILSNVTLNGAILLNWENFSLPLDEVSSLPYDDSNCSGSCLREANFSLDSVGDTFLMVHGMKKGMVWLNGRALGRVWEIGPQETLFVPASWLRKGNNSVVVFTLDGQDSVTVEGLTDPALGKIILAD